MVCLTCCAMSIIPHTLLRMNGTSRHQVECAPDSVTGRSDPAALTNRVLWRQENLPGRHCCLNALPRTACQGVRPDTPSVSLRVIRSYCRASHRHTLLKRSLTACLSKAPPSPPLHGFRCPHECLFLPPSASPSASLSSQRRTADPSSARCLVCPESSSQPATRARVCSW